MGKCVVLYADILSTAWKAYIIECWVMKNIMCKHYNIEKNKVLVIQSKIEQPRKVFHDLTCILCQ